MITIPRYNKAVAITPSDTNNIGASGKGTSAQAQLTDAIYVGAAGDVTVVFQDDSTALVKAPPVGTILPLAVKRVNATGTTASQLLALYRI